METENLLNQYHWNIKEYNKFGIFDFAQVIAKSIGEINENLVYKQKWKNILKPALIHKLLRIELGIQRA